MPIGSLLITGIMPLIGWLHSSNAGLGNPCPSGIVHICNSAICRSLLESLKHFFSVHTINFIHASTYPLLCWQYDDKNACSMFRLLPKVLNLSKIILPPESDIIFLGTPYSAKMIYMLKLGCLLIDLWSC